MRDANLCGACDAWFLVCGTSRDIGHALERAFPGFFGDFVVAEVSQEKRCMNTQDFTRFLSTGVVTASSHTL